MKKILFLVLLFPLLALANGIDDHCPKLRYKSAPVVNADKFICHQQYAVAYSYSHKTPIYTTEFLESADIGELPRSDNFRPDPNVPSIYSATVADYKGTTTECGGARCDRGHMTPSQDFSSCEVCVSESFYLSNMVPQNYQNNEIIWKYLETKIRKYVAANNPVYVITGPIYNTTPPKTIGNGKVAVPDMLFKVVIDSKTGESIAFMMVNKNYPVGDLNGLIVTLSILEQATGIKFDKSLNKKKSGSYQAWFSGLK